MNVMKRQGKLVKSEEFEDHIDMNEVQAPNDIPMQESVDKLSIQLALICLSYFVAYLLMFTLGNLISGMRSVIYGFNFLLGVLAATIVKLTLNFLKKKHIVKKDYANNFLLTRTSNFFFDIMVVAGIAAIRLDLLENYWGIIAILALLGLIVTYIYNRIVAKTLFKKYSEEQFMAMYGMLTGTASSGIILLREIDGDFETPVADNLVYQNFPAIVFGLPMMFLANWCPNNPPLVLAILGVLFVLINILLFRSKIFKSKKSDKAE
jgi:ESS family glutamate:Na+ symporter